MKQNKCEIKNVAYTTVFNGELVDDGIIKFIRDAIEKEHSDMKLDPYVKKDVRNMKNHIKILKTAVSIKEKLSASGASDINAEVSDIIYNEDDDDYEDFTTRISIDDIAKIVKEDLHGKKVIFGLLDKCLENVNESTKSKMNMVIVGGTTRIPSIKEMLNDYVKNYLKSEGNLIFTLNQDEALSSGISYYSAIKEKWWNYSYTLPKNNPHKMIYNTNSDSMTESDNVKKCDKYTLNDEEKNYVNNLNGMIDNFMQETEILRIKSGILNDIESLWYIIYIHIYSFSYDFDKLESKIKKVYLSKREEIFSIIRNPQVKSKSPDQMKEIYEEMESVIKNCKLFDEKQYILLI